ncbi:hypothetical protein [Streptomyces sp. NBC_00304]|nr:hypothetical protein [Streptomyces sp. NBC_00304]
MNRTSGRAALQSVPGTVDAAGKAQRKPVPEVLPLVPIVLPMRQ